MTLSCGLTIITFVLLDCFPLLLHFLAFLINFFSLKLHKDLGWACVLSSFSHVQLFATLWTVALQAPLSMGFTRQEYWNVLPFPPPGDLADPGIEPA